MEFVGGRIHLIFPILQKYTKIEHQYTTDGGVNWLALTSGRGQVGFNEPIYNTSSGGLLLRSVQYTFNVRQKLQDIASGTFLYGKTSPSVQSNGWATAAPSPPSLTSGVGGDQSITLTWTPGLIAGVSYGSYTGYDYSTDGGTTYRSIPNIDASTATTGTVTLNSTTGLAFQTGTTYNVVIRARIGTYAGTPSTSIAVTPSILPGAPVLGSATRGDLSIVLTWTAPTSTTDSPAITGYEYRTHPTDSWLALTYTGATTLTATITTNSNGFPLNAIPYTVSIRGLNPYAGPHSDFQVVVPYQSPVPQGLYFQFPGNGIIMRGQYSGTGNNSIFSIIEPQYTTNNGTDWKAFPYVDNGPANDFLPVITTTSDNGTLFSDVQYTFIVRMKISSSETGIIFSKQSAPATTNGYVVRPDPATGAGGVQLATTTAPILFPYRVGPFTIESSSPYPLPSGFGYVIPDGNTPNYDWSLGYAASQLLFTNGQKRVFTVKHTSWGGQAGGESIGVIESPVSLPVVQPFIRFADNGNLITNSGTATRDFTKFQAGGEFIDIAVDYTNSQAKIWYRVNNGPWQG